MSYGSTLNKVFWLYLTFIVAVRSILQNENYAMAKDGNADHDGSFRFHKNGTTF